MGLADIDMSGLFDGSVQCADVAEYPQKLMQTEWTLVSERGG